MYAFTKPLALLVISLPLISCLDLSKVKIDPNIQKLNVDTIKADAIKKFVPNIGEEVLLPVSELTAGKNIKIQVPALEVLAGGLDPETRITTALKKSVPKAITDFGRANDLSADEGVNVIKQAIQGVIAGDLILAKRELEARSLWGWIKGAGCALFATAAVPGYLAAAADLWIANGKDFNNVDKHGTYTIPYASYTVMTTPPKIPITMRD